MKKSEEEMVPILRLKRKSKNSDEFIIKKPKYECPHSSQETFISDMPIEIIVHILNQMEFEDVIKICSKVCVLWDEISTLYFKQSFLMKLAKRDIGIRRKFNTKSWSRGCQNLTLISDLYETYTKKHFCFTGVTAHRDDLHEKVLKLGGRSKKSEDMYTSDYTTHFVVNKDWEMNKKYTSMLLGAIGSGKYPYIVTEDYIHESFKRKRFRREDPYIPKTIKKIQNSYRKNGLVFQNQNVLVLMRDFRKQMELKTIGKYYIACLKIYSKY